MTFCVPDATPDARHISSFGDAPTVTTALAVIPPMVILLIVTLLIIPAHTTTFPPFPQSIEKV